MSASRSSTRRGSIPRSSSTASGKKSSSSSSAARKRSIDGSSSPALSASALSPPSLASLYAHSPFYTGTSRLPPFPSHSSPVRASAPTPFNSPLAFHSHSVPAFSSLSRAAQSTIHKISNSRRDSLKSSAEPMAFTSSTGDNSPFLSSLASVSDNFSSFLQRQRDELDQIKQFRENKQKQIEELTRSQSQSRSPTREAIPVARRRSSLSDSSRPSAVDSAVSSSLSHLSRAAHSSLHRLSQSIDSHRASLKSPAESTPSPQAADDSPFMSSLSSVSSNFSVFLQRQREELERLKEFREKKWKQLEDQIHSQPEPAAASVRPSSASASLGDSSIRRSSFASSSVDSLPIHSHQHQANSSTGPISPSSVTSPSLATLLVSHTDLRVENDQLRHRVYTQSSSMQELSHQVSSLQDENAALKKSLQWTQMQSDSHAMELKQLETQFVARLNQLEVMFETERNQLRGQNQELQKDNTRLARDYEELHRESNLYKANSLLELNELKAQYWQMQVELEFVRNQHGKEGSQLESVMQSLRACEASNGELSQEYVELKNWKLQSLDWLERLKEENKGLMVKEMEWAEKYERLMAEKAQLQLECEKLRNDQHWSGYESELRIAEGMEGMAWFSGELERLKLAFQREQELFQQEKQRHHSELERVEKEKSQLKNEFEEKWSKWRSEREQMGEKEEEKEREKDRERAEWWNEIERLERENNEMRGKWRERESEMEAKERLWAEREAMMQSKLEAAEKEKAEQTAAMEAKWRDKQDSEEVEMKEFARKYEELVVLNQELSKKVHAKGSALKESEKRAREFEDRLRAQDREKAEAAKLIVEWEEEKKSIESRLENEVNTLKQQVRESESALKNVYQEYKSALESKNSLLQAKSGEFQAKLKEIESEWSVKCRDLLKETEQLRGLLNAERLRSNSLLQHSQIVISGMENSKMAEQSQMLAQFQWSLNRIREEIQGIKEDGNGMNAENKTGEKKEETPASPAPVQASAPAQSAVSPVPASHAFPPIMISVSPYQQPVVVSAQPTADSSAVSQPVSRDIHNPFSTPASHRSTPMPIPVPSPNPSSLFPSFQFPGPNIASSLPVMPSAAANPYYFSTALLSPGYTPKP